MKLAWNKTRFVKSAVWPEQYPKFGHHVSQVAICGRSNVGKSSLINELCSQKSLAKTSSTPGKTQLINFFTIDERLVLVDLPGYGYAKVPDAIKKDWGKIIDGYLNKAERLDLILFLLDIRRTPTADDLQFLDWLFVRSKPFIIVLTKADKLSKNEAEKQTRIILEALPYEGIEHILHSSKSHQGTYELRQRIEEYVTN